VVDLPAAARLFSAESNVETRNVQRDSATYGAEAALDALSWLDLTPYAGYWVALVKGRVVGVGRTERAARVAAKRNRPKDTPVVVWVDAEGRIRRRV